MKKDKRDLTANDIVFLNELQNEMNTQDTVGQASPRYWAVRDIERVYDIALEIAEKIEILRDGDVIANSFNDFINYLNAYLNENEKPFELVAFSSNREYSIDVKNQDGELIRFCEVSVDVLIDKLQDKEVLSTYYEYRARGYNEEFRIKESSFFLTNDECKKHIKENAHHYTERAHSYAMTAWRSPQVEKLYELLENINFEKTGGINAI